MQMSEPIKCHLPFNPYIYKDLFKRHNKQITITKVVEEYVAPWHPESGRALCSWCVGLASRADCCSQWCHPPASSLPPLLPFPATWQLCSLGGGGVARNWEAHCLERHFCPHSTRCYVSPTSNEHHPVHQKHGQSHHWIHSLHLLQLPNTQQNQMPTILIYTWGKCHLEVVLHSPFIANGKSKCQAISDFSRGLTLVQKLS